jgi:hypothetical protein
MRVVRPALGSLSMGSRIFWKKVAKSESYFGQNFLGVAFSETMNEHPAIIEHANGKGRCTVTMSRAARYPLAFASSANALQPRD